MKKILFTITAALFGFTAFAQTNFSGTWSISDKQMITGPEYINALPKLLKIEQARDSVSIEYTYDTTDGADQVSKHTYAIDGKEMTRTGKTSKRKTVMKLQWSADKSALVITTVFYIPENPAQVDFTRIETWSIKDGHLVIDERSEETRSETWQVKGIFDKS